MANLAKRQTKSHSLNRGFGDLAHRFVNAHTHAHTHPTQINIMKEHGQLTGFPAGSKNVFLENTICYFRTREPSEEIVLT